MEFCDCINSGCIYFKHRVRRVENLQYCMYAGVAVMVQLQHREQVVTESGEVAICFII